MVKYLYVILILINSSSVFAAEEADKAIHDELRAALNGIETAINSEKYAEMAPYFHKSLHITTVNQEVITSREEIAAYFNKWFGPDGYLKKLEIKLTADSKTDFYANKTMGIVHGFGIENYRLSDTRYFPMKTRWTATVIKDTDGKWRILALHIGTNFLDNPLLSATKDSILYYTIGGVAGGFLLCLIIWYLTTCKRKERKLFS